MDPVTGGSSGPPLEVQAMRRVLATVVALLTASIVMSVVFFFVVRPRLEHPVGPKEAAPESAETIDVQTFRRMARRLRRVHRGSPNPDV